MENSEARSLAGVRWQPQQQSGLISPQRCSVGHSGGRGGQRGYCHHRIAVLLPVWPRPQRPPAPQPQPPRQQRPQSRPRRPLQQCWRPTPFQRPGGCRQLRGRCPLLLGPFFRSPEKDGLFSQPQQRIRIRPRPRPHRRPAGLVAAEDSFTAAASRGPFSHRGDSTTGTKETFLLKVFQIVLIFELLFFFFSAA